MNAKKQHDLLILVQDKLTKHFDLDEEQCNMFFLTQDDEETSWILFAYKAIFSFEDKGDALLVSFDKSLEPNISAEIIFCLVRNNIELRVMECFYESKINGEIYWGEKAEILYGEEILLENEECERCERSNLH